MCDVEIEWAEGNCDVRSVLCSHFSDLASFILWNLQLVPHRISLQLSLEEFTSQCEIKMSLRIK